VVLEDNGNPSVNHKGTLSGHTKTVNCIRFSPCGNYLISSGDHGELLLWQAASSNDPKKGTSESPFQESDGTWRRAALLRGHTDDVMDVSWSPDGTALLSGSIDNKVIVWEISEKKKGKMITQFANHRHFVQGVTWDPAQKFIITQSADRTCKVYSLRPPPAGSKRNKITSYLTACDSAKDFFCSYTMSRRSIKTETRVVDREPANTEKTEQFPLFLDESMPSFFRRLSWSPDGSILAVPAGSYRSSRTSSELYTAYLYARGCWATPVLHLPAQTKPILAIRFCPAFFKRSENKNCPAVFESLPYKMVFAVASLDSVILYDTESILPVAVLGQLHYDSITDLAWSKDGRFLAIASRDSYCTIATFDEGELGETLSPENLSDLAVTAVQGLSSRSACKSFSEQKQERACTEKITGLSATVVGSHDDNECQKIVMEDAIAARKRDHSQDDISPKAAVAHKVKDPEVRPSKRITPIMINPAVAKTSSEDEVSRSKSLKLDPVDGYSSDRGVKRITPTPITNHSPPSPAFENSKINASESTPTGAENASNASSKRSAQRRIKPIPLSHSPQPLAEPTKPASVAALALAAGRQAVAEANRG
jgi:chromatin assembly factor 1 subunit B